MQPGVRDERSNVSCGTTGCSTSARLDERKLGCERVDRLLQEAHSPLAVRTGRKVKVISGWLMLPLLSGESQAIRYKDAYCATNHRSASGRRCVAECLEAARVNQAGGLARVAILTVMLKSLGSRRQSRDFNGQRQQASILARDH